MKTVLVKSIHSVDTISKGNPKAWNKLMDYMSNEEKDNKVMFDFKGIEVIQPWVTPEFKLFMQDERVNIKLWCSANTVHSINIMCTLNGFETDRAINEEIIPKKVLTKEEIQIARMSEELQRYFEIEDGIPVLNIYKRFDQIGVPITVSYIEGALKKYAKEHNVNKLKLEVKGITVQTSVIENITELIKKLGAEDVELIIHSNDADVMNKVGMYRSRAANKVSDKDKLKLIKSTLYNGKVGMLMRYKDSKATDEFGRSGNGKAISCRVAIYTGIKRERDNSICVCFKSFNGNTFFTHTHWELEHDNNELDALDCKEEIIPLEQFGMYSDFLGSKFHFITPVQLSKEATMTMYGLNEMGKVTYTSMTIPERIKAVFDDWDIPYDIESIQTYIKKTKEILG